MQPPVGKMDKIERLKILMKQLKQATENVGPCRLKTVKERSVCTILKHVNILWMERIDVVRGSAST